MYIKWVLVVTFFVMKNVPINIIFNIQNQKSTKSTDQMLDDFIFTVNNVFLTLGIFSCLKRTPLIAFHGL